MSQFIHFGINLDMLAICSSVVRGSCLLAAKKKRIFHALLERRNLHREGSLDQRYRRWGGKVGVCPPSLEAVGGWS